MRCCSVLLKYGVKEWLFYNCGKWLLLPVFTRLKPLKITLKNHFSGWQIKIPVEFLPSLYLGYKNYSTDEKCIIDPQDIIKCLQGQELENSPWTNKSIPIPHLLPFPIPFLKWSTKLHHILPFVILQCWELVCKKVMCSIRLEKKSLPHEGECVLAYNWHTHQ